jgi:hypothetical protein
VKLAHDGVAAGGDAGVIETDLVGVDAELGAAGGDTVVEL